MYYNKHKIKYTFPVSLLSDIADEKSKENSKSADQTGK